MSVYYLSEFPGGQRLQLHTDIKLPFHDKRHENRRHRKDTSDHHPDKQEQELQWKNLIEEMPNLFILSDLINNSPEL
jgi:hypothetical protein